MPNNSKVWEFRIRNANLLKYLRNCSRHAVIAFVLVGGLLGYTGAITHEIEHELATDNHAESCQICDLAGSTTDVQSAPALLRIFTNVIEKNLAAHDLSVPCRQAACKNQARAPPELDC